MWVCVCLTGHIFCSIALILTCSFIIMRGKTESIWSPKVKVTMGGCRHYRPHFCSIDSYFTCTFIFKSGKALSILRQKGHGRYGTSYKTLVDTIQDIFLFDLFHTSHESFTINKGRTLLIFWSKGQGHDGFS